MKFVFVLVIFSNSGSGALQVTIYLETRSFGVGKESWRKSVFLLDGYHILVHSVVILDRMNNI